MINDPAGSGAGTFAARRASKRQPGGITPGAIEREGVFRGSADDLRDPFNHLSTPKKAEGTRARHFAAELSFIALTLDTVALGEALRWEPSRGLVLSSHIYPALTIADVVEARF